MKKKIFFWLPYTDRILEGLNPPGAIGGANVQLAFWAKYFAEKNWQSYAITCYLNSAFRKIFGIKYLYFPEIKHVNFFLQYFQLFYLAIIRPNVVVTRSQNAFELNLIYNLSKLLKFKLVHTLASDLDVITDTPNPFLKFQKTLGKLDYIIAQNEFQQHGFIKNIRRINVPIIPNIFDKNLFLSIEKSQYNFDAIWIGNYRSVKRPELLIELARQHPELNFGMIGIEIENGADKSSKNGAEELNNLQILGYRSLFETTIIISQSKVLVCTSLAEGFPNTFLQAWSSNIPVLSTVNPNRVITTYQLGIIAENISELSEGLTKIITNNTYYIELQHNIRDYFTITHDPETNFKVFESYIN